MTKQLDFSSFSEKTVSFAEFTKNARKWNKAILDWEIEYTGYHRDDGHKGFIDLQVIVEIMEAIIIAKNPKTSKKIEKPGYKLTVTQNMAFEDKEWEGVVVHEEPFEKRNLQKAFDAFQRELLNIQSKDNTNGK